MPAVLPGSSCEVATSMTLEEAIRSRRSVRGFLDKPVPQDVLEKVFELAQWAPSNCNIQPWNVLVASGETRDKIRAKLMENVKNRVAPNPDYPYPGKFEGDYRTRQVACAVAMYSTMNIGRDDQEGRARAAFRNFELFDAPHVAFICMDQKFGATVAVDVGMYAQNLMLAMTAYGIASCAQGSMRNYPDVAREAFGVAPELRVLFGISFGYEDPDVPANQTRTVRAELGENVIFRD